MAGIVFDLQGNALDSLDSSMSPQRLSVIVTKLREGQGLTPRDLAKKAKVTAAYVAMIETGVRKNPSLVILRRLAKALGVPVTALLE